MVFSSYNSLSTRENKIPIIPITSAYLAPLADTLPNTPGAGTQFSKDHVKVCSIDLTELNYPGEMNESHFLYQPKRQPTPETQRNWFLKSFDL
jgi:hypothetical protein